MNRLNFDYPFNLVDTITALLDDVNDDYPVISVYGKYDVIKDILEDLIMSGISIANEIELQDYEVSNYDKEFVLYLTKSGINVEKIWCDDTYYYGSADISFIHEDCNSKLIKYVDSKIIYEFGYKYDNFNDDEYDCTNCDLEECIHCGEVKSNKQVEYSKDDDGDLHGFTASKSDGNSSYSYSVYTSDKLSLKDIQSLLQEVGF